MKQYDNVLLVTGGAGFIGSAFLRMLVPMYPNWYFVNLDALTYAGDLRKVESVKDYDNYLFVHGNICDRPLVESLFDKYNINIVVNFAAESHVDNSIKDAESFIETNIKGAYILLDVAKTKWGFDGKSECDLNYRFLQISTDEVYGSLGVDDCPWTEDSIIAPNSPYSASKAAAELLARSFHKTFKLPVIVTRSSNNFGPFQNYEKLIPTLIQSIKLQQSLPLYGSGTNIRDWIYVDDNIKAIEQVLIKGHEGHVYNIGGDNEISNIELAKMILKETKSKVKIELIKDRLGHDFRYAVDSRKLKELGFQPGKDFKTKIRLTINHYLLYNK